MFFGECCITHKPGEESRDGVGRFLVSPGIQVIGEILESLFTSIDLLQALYNLLLDDDTKTTRNGSLFFNYPNYNSSIILAKSPNCALL